MSYRLSPCQAHRSFYGTGHRCPLVPATPPNCSSPCSRLPQKSQVRPAEGRLASPGEV